MSALAPQRDWFHVAVRKYEDEVGVAFSRWQRLYFEHIYLRFLRLSLKYMGIPAPSEIEFQLKNGTTIVFVWVEGIAIASTKAKADSMCADRFYRVAPLPLDSPLPRESIQYKPHSFPRSDDPHRYAEPVLPLTAVPRGRDDSLRAGLDRLSEILTDDDEG